MTNMIPYALLSMPLVASIVAQVDPTTTSTDLVRQLLDQGLIGLVAVIFFWCWREAEKRRERDVAAEVAKREMAEKRERQLLRQLHNLPPEPGDGDETLPVPPPGRSERLVQTQPAIKS